MAALIERDQLQEFISRGGQLVEVLPAKEYGEDHLPSARSIPLSKINHETTSILDVNSAVVVYCWDTA